MRLSLCILQSDMRRMFAFVCMLFYVLEATHVLADFNSEFSVWIYENEEEESIPRAILANKEVRCSKKGQMCLHDFQLPTLDRL